MTTSTPLDGSGSGSYSIPDLVKLVSEGSIRVPKFQRSFVWDAGNVRTLFDSVFREFPIGTLLLWKQPGPAGVINFGPIELAVPAKADALWVVDGQQRITSLFGALSPNHAGVDERFEIFFDLATKKFVNPRRGAVPPRSLPVREALETRRLLNWLRVHDEDLEAEDFDVADRLGGVLRDYKIPAYVVVGDDHDVLREVFDRVNSAGRPIKRAQVFHALFASETEPGSPATVIEQLKELNFGAIDDSRVLQSLLAIRGGDVQRDVHEEFSSTEDPADWYEQTERALARSIEFLRSEGVDHILLAPNTLPLPVLAAFFHVHPDPEPWTKRLLSRWLWRGWVHGFGKEGGQTPVLRRAIRSVNPKKDSAQAPDEFTAVRSLLEYVDDRSAPLIPVDNFRTNTANARLILLALASLRPLDSIGQPINLAQEFERHGADAVTTFVPGNRTQAGARGFWPREIAPPTLEIAPSILKSHLLDDVTVRQLETGNVEEFIDLRSTAIERFVSNFLESKLDTKGLIRRSLTDLIMVGSEEDGE